MKSGTYLDNNLVANLPDKLAENLKEARQHLGFWQTEQWRNLQAADKEAVAISKDIIDLAGTILNKFDGFRSELSSSVPGLAGDYASKQIFGETMTALNNLRNDATFGKGGKYKPRVEFSRLLEHCCWAIDGMEEGLSAMGKKLPAEAVKLKAAAERYKKVIHSNEVASGTKARVMALTKFLVALRDCDVLLEEANMPSMDDIGVKHLLYMSEPDKTIIGSENEGSYPSSAELSPVDYEEDRVWRAVLEQMEKLAEQAVQRQKALATIRANFTEDMEAARTSSR